MASALMQRLLIVACILVIFLTLFSFGRYQSSSIASYGPSLGKGSHKHSSENSSAWAFDPRIDANNYGLSYDQCEAAFPKFWDEIDRAVAVRHKKGNVKPEELDISWRADAIMRLMIWEKQLYIVNLKGCRARDDYRERSLATLLNIQRAVASFPGELPNVEFSFSVDDWAYPKDKKDAPIWTWTRKPEWENAWLMPDFNFWSWPAKPIGAYNDILREIATLNTGFEDKIPKAMWRGATLIKEREDLLRIAEDKEWADVKEYIWGAEHAEEMAKIEISTPHYCDYKYPIHTEGRANSGRLKFLLNCHAVTIIHTMEWIEHYHALLVADGVEQNYLPVARDFYDLDEKMGWILSQPDTARRIADNSARVFRDRYLTPAAQACYWRKLLWAWKSVSFEPEFYKEEETEDGKKQRVPRGMPFETYILILQDENRNPFHGNM